MASTPAAATATLPAAAAPASQSGPGADPAERPFVDVPRLLGQWQLIAVVAAVLFGVLTAGLLTAEWWANRQAAATTAQLVRVQDIKSSLVRADALATNAFLVGGLEPTDRAAAYDSAVDGVFRGITEAADAQPADEAALEALMVNVRDYAESVELARANNRQGYPVGAAYLREASASLRADSLPILDALVTANRDRAESAMGAHRPYLVVLPGILALAALWWINQRLRRTFHRRHNRGLVLAGLIILGTGALASVSSAYASVQAHDVRTGSFAQTVASSTARSEANNAKANESLALIARGSGQAFYTAFDDAAAVVVDQLDKAGFGEALDQWQAYAQAHAAIAELDNSGAWDEAVAAATSTEAGSATATFDRLDTALAQYADTTASKTAQTLGAGTIRDAILALLAVIAGVAAAVAVVRGLAERKAEFA